MHTPSALNHNPQKFQYSCARKSLQEAQSSASSPILCLREALENRTRELPTSGLDPKQSPLGPSLGLNSPAGVHADKTITRSLSPHVQFRRLPVCAQRAEGNPFGAPRRRTHAARSEESSQVAGIYAEIPWLRLTACAFPKSFASVRSIKPGNHFLQHVGEHQNRPLGALCDGA